MNNEDIKTLLVKYITGEADEFEKDEVKFWINAHPENEQYFAQLYETWQNMLYLEPGIINEHKAYERFAGLQTPKKVLRIHFIKWGKIAAIVIVGLFLSVNVIRHYTANLQNKRLVAAKKGTIRKIVLNDGTIVWLNAGSKLNFTADFGTDTRTVYLEGEAFFDIAPGKKNIPFIVNTKKYTIRDIGTKFNLKAYPNDPVFETTVISGEVSVENNVNTNNRNNNRIHIKQRQVLRIYNKAKAESYAYRQTDRNTYKPGDVPDMEDLNEIQILQIDSAKLNRYNGWKEDLLVFDGNTLAEITSVLERRYNVEINMKDTVLQNIRYYGTFKSIESIQKVLEIIKANTPIVYTINSNKIYITKASTNNKKQ
jgi:transmembrane sensor